MSSPRPEAPAVAVCASFSRAGAYRRGPTEPAIGPASWQQLVSRITKARALALHPRPASRLSTATARARNGTPASAQKLVYGPSSKIIGRWFMLG